MTAEVKAEESSRRCRRISAAIFVGLSALYALTGSGHSHSPDEEDLYQTTASLVHARSTIEVNEDNDRVTSHIQGREGPVGRRPLGQSVVGIPMLLVGRVAAIPAPQDHKDTVVRFFTLLTNAFVTAGGAVLVLRLSTQLGASLSGGTSLALAYGLGTFAWPLATTYFSDSLSATIIAALALLAIRARHEPTRSRAVVIGVLCGLAVMVRLTNIIFVPLVGIYLLTAWFEKLGTRNAVRLVGLSAAGLSIPLSIQLASSWWRYGSFFAVAYSGPNVRFDTPLLEGLSGFLFSPGRSVFLFAPITVLGLVGVFRAKGGHRRDVILLTFMTASNLLLWSLFHSWEGGQVWGPRFLLITLPLWVVLAAPVVDTTWGRRSTIGLAALGLALNLPGIVIYQNAYYQVLAADVGREIVDGRVAYFHASVHDLANSQIVGHARLMRSAVVETASRIAGQNPAIAPYPRTVNERYFWHDFPIQVDIWWATWLPKKAPAGYLLLVPVWIVVCALAFLKLRSGSRRQRPKVAAGGEDEG